MARSLVAQGHSVRIRSRTWGPLLTDFATEAPVRVEFLSKFRRRLRELQLPRFVSYLVDSTVALGTILVNRPDVVYVNSCAASIYLRPALFLRRKTILHSHESGSVSAKFVATARAKAALPSATLVACSPSVRLELAEVAGVPPTAIHLLASVPDDARVLELAGEPSELQSREGQVVIGCCGSVEHRKGADLWIDAAAEVRRRRPDLDVRFVWVGDRDDEPVDHESTEVEFIGGRANPYPIMRSFDIATLPSRDDPFPLVVVESMLLGRPVVAFDVGAVADQVGPAGILVPSGDVHAFATAIVELVTSLDQRKKLGELAHERATSLYSTSSFSKKLGEILWP